MPRYDYILETDENGYFQKSARFNPPGPFSLTLDLSVTLKKPADTLAQGRLDIDPADGGRGNLERAFAVRSGEKAGLGTWSLDGGDNIVVLSGRTEPPRADEQLEITLEASF